MIEGRVNAHLEAVVTLPLQGLAQQAHHVDAVIDTGFSGYLTLPPVLVADDTQAAFDVYGATVLWDGPRYVEAAGIGTDPLIGMAMLGDHDLSIQVRDGGSVTIRAAG